MQKKRIGGFWHRGSLEGPSIVEVSRVFVAASEKFKKELQAVLCSDPVRVCGEVPPAGLLSQNTSTREGLPDAPCWTCPSLWEPLISDPCAEHGTDCPLFVKICNISQVNNSQHLLNTFTTPGPRPL